MSLKSLTPVNHESRRLVLSRFSGEAKIVPASDAPLESVQVLVSCHSLVQLDEEMVGDPLEKACLVSLDWMLTKSNRFRDE